MPKCLIVVNMVAAHDKTHAGWMMEGLKRQGWDVAFHTRHVPISYEGVDMLCCWSVKKASVWQWHRITGGPVLVMERGHLQPRTIYTSLGFNGLSRRATYAQTLDGGERWRKHFAQLEKPWRTGGEVTIVCGQVAGDAAIWGVNFQSWAQTCIDLLRGQGKKVVYRPHPFSLRQGDLWKPKGAEWSNPLTKLEADMQRAEAIVTYNSTAGVEAVLEGVPTVTFDKGAMAWDVTSHKIADPLVQPDRTAWQHRMAYTSWHPDEIKSGEAWEHVKTALPLVTPEKEQAYG